MKKLWHVRRYVIEHYRIVAESRKEAKDANNLPFHVESIRETAEVFDKKGTR